MLTNTSNATMTASLLVSASVSNIKVWNLLSTSGTKTNGSLSLTGAPEQLYGVELSSFPPAEATTANAVRWNHDNQWLAAAGNAGTLTIHEQNGTLVETIPLDVGEALRSPDITAIRFAGRSRYLMYGGTDHVIHVWDRKASQYGDSLKGHNTTISCLDLNLDETLVASSSLGGDVIIHNRQTASQYNLVVLTKQPVNTLEYSYFKSGLLAAGGEDGVMRMWDTTASTTAIQTFDNAHCSAVKGVCFSSINTHLMCSCGMDKRVVLYDVGKKSILQTIHTDHPLTALSFKPDGVTLAAGTSQGKIIVYDLRKSSKPVCTLSGKDSHPIRSLHFQGKDKLAEKRLSSAKAKGHARNPSGKMLSSSTKRKSSSSSSSPAQSPREAKDKNYMDMFSPVKDNHTSPTKTVRTGSPTTNVLKSGSGSGSGNRNTKNNSKIAVAQAGVTAKSEIVTTASNGTTRQMQSPASASLTQQPNSLTNITATSAEVKDSTVRNVRVKIAEHRDGRRVPTRTSSPSSPPRASPLPPLSSSAFDRTQTSLQSARPSMASNVKNAIPSSTKSSDFLDGKRAINAMAVQTALSSPTPPASPSPPPPPPPPPHSQPTETVLPAIQSTTAAPELPSIQSTTAAPELPSIQSTTPAPVLPSIQSTTPAPVFSRKVLENIVEECLQDFRASMRNDIQNMHLELLRQFHIQKIDMEMMFVKYCGEISTLREENERLREENQRLKLKLLQ